VLKTSNLYICKFLEIYLIWTLSSSDNSNNLELMKVPKPIKLGLLKNNGLIHKTQHEPLS